MVVDTVMEVQHTAGRHTQRGGVLRSHVVGQNAACNHVWERSRMGAGDAAAQAGRMLQESPSSTSVVESKFYG